MLRQRSVWTDLQFKGLRHCECCRLTYYWTGVRTAFLSQVVCFDNRRLAYTDLQIKVRLTYGQVSLAWNDLGDPFLVELSKDKSATGAHEMISLFVDVHAVEVSINGKGVDGKPFPREFAGKKNSSTAFLAFSETWIKA